MGQGHTGPIFLCAIETNSLNSLTVQKTPDKHQQNDQQDQNEYYRRGDAYPLPEGIIVNIIRRVTGFITGGRWLGGFITSGGCGFRGWWCAGAIGEGKRGGGGGTDRSCDNELCRETVIYIATYSHSS